MKANDLLKMNKVELKKLREKINLLLGDEEEKSTKSKKKRKKELPCKNIDKHPYLDNFYQTICEMLSYHSTEKYPKTSSALTHTKIYPKLIQAQITIDDYLDRIYPKASKEHRLNFYRLACWTGYLILEDWTIEVTLSTFINITKHIPARMLKEVPFLGEDVLLVRVVLERAHRIDFTGGNFYVEEV